MLGKILLAFLSFYFALIALDVFGFGIMSEQIFSVGGIIFMFIYVIAVFGLVKSS